ncbi:Extracellular serine protease precursor [compost metagenome]
MHGTLGWRHAFGDLNPASTLSFVQGSDSFTATGAPIARDAAVIELGVGMEVSKRTTVGLIYGGQFGQGNSQNSGTLDVRYRF